MGFMDVLGAIATPVSNIASSIIGAKSNNRNIDKQIDAQGQENQKTREYNLMLAQMQNAWNQEQWERENEYNSPVNQMKRFKEAGLNPDLMYQNGNSGNAAQLSGGLTSGAPATPQDFSALGQKKTIGHVIQDSLDRSFQMAQIDAIKANTEKTLNESGLTGIELQTKRALQLLTGSDAEEMLSTLKDSNPLVRSAVVTLANLEKDYSLKGNKLEEQRYDLTIKEQDARLASKRADKLYEDLCNRVQISKHEAEVWVKSTADRIRGIRLDADLKENEALWTNADFLKDLPQGLPVFIKLLRLALGK